MRRKANLACVLSMLAAGLQGCAGYPWNAPAIAQDSLIQPSLKVAAAGDSARDDDVFIVLAFSGGGMRSAAFSYGLLEALRDATVTLHGHTRQLLDEVDVITSVSGGSYTAAYYGLFGERIFSDFEAAFLKRDIQGELTSLLVNPLALASLATPGVNRSDISAAWFGEHVFENKTFADMRWPSGPFVIVNASDINTGTTFSFIQQQFDFLCSRIDNFPVARAVMASSAVPGYFAPIAVRNYRGDCPRRRSGWVERVLEERDIYSRNYGVARGIERYLQPEEMPIVRLVDGGITDNLGVRGSMLSPVMHYGNVEEMSGAFDERALDTVSKVLVIVANAQIYEDYRWSREGREPGLISSVSASFDSAIGVLNNETIVLARRGFMQWARRVNERPTRAGKPPVEVSFAALTFDQIRDGEERRYFNAIPTTLSLPVKQVDDVRELAKRLLNASPEYQGFLKSFP